MFFRRKRRVQNTSNNTSFEFPSKHELHLSANFQIWTSENITLNMYKHLQWLQITFFRIKSIWRKLTNRVDIRRGNVRPSQREISIILSNEIIPPSRRTSPSFYGWNIIILSMDQHNPTNESSTNHHHPINISMENQHCASIGSSPSYQWIINE